MTHNEKRCSNCGAALRFASNEKLQLGQTGWLLGDLPNLLAGALSLSVWYCPGCGKIEFYVREGDACFDEEGDDRIAQVKCPYCGHRHDMDDAVCPLCNNRLM